MHDVQAKFYRVRTSEELVAKRQNQSKQCVNSKLSHVLFFLATQMSKHHQIWYEYHALKHLPCIYLNSFNILLIYCSRKKADELGSRMAMSILLFLFSRTSKGHEIFDHVEYIFLFFLLSSQSWFVCIFRRPSRLNLF